MNESNEHYIVSTYLWILLQMYESGAAVVATKSSTKSSTMKAAAAEEHYASCKQSF